jgi:hypothetical protein
MKKIFQEKGGNREETSNEELKVVEQEGPYEVEVGALPLPGKGRTIIQHMRRGRVGYCGRD